MSPKRVRNRAHSACVEKWDSTSVSDTSALHTYSCCPWLPVLHCDIYLKCRTLGVIKLSSAAACKFAYNSGRSYRVFIHAQPPLHTTAEGRDTLWELLSPPDLPFLILPVAPLAITPSFSSVDSHCFPPPSLPFAPPGRSVSLSGGDRGKWGLSPLQCGDPLSASSASSLCASELVCMCPCV